MMFLSLKKNGDVSEKKMKSTTRTMKSAAVSGTDARHPLAPSPYLARVFVSTGVTWAPTLALAAPDPVFRGSRCSPRGILAQVVLGHI